MENEIGNVKTTISLVKKDEELTSRIIEKLNIQESKREEVRDILRYNVWTANQFSDITGLPISTVNNLSRPTFEKGKLITKLDFCYPHSDLNGVGQKFIVRNEKSEKYLP